MLEMVMNLWCYIYMYAIKIMVSSRQYLQNIVLNLLLLYRPTAVESSHIIIVFCF